MIQFSVLSIFISLFDFYKYINHNPLSSEVFAAVRKHMAVFHTYSGVTTILNNAGGTQTFLSTKMWLLSVMKPKTNVNLYGVFKMYAFFIRLFVQQLFFIGAGIIQQEIRPLSVRLHDMLLPIQQPVHIIIDFYLNSIVTITFSIFQNHSRQFIEDEAQGVRLNMDGRACVTDGVAYGDINGVVYFFCDGMRI